MFSPMLSAETRNPAMILMKRKGSRVPKPHLDADDNEEKKVPGTSRKQEEELEKGDDLVGAKEKMLEVKAELEEELIKTRASCIR